MTLVFRAVFSFLATLSFTLAICIWCSSLFNSLRWLRSCSCNTLPFFVLSWTALNPLRVNYRYNHQRSINLSSASQVVVMVVYSTYIELAIEEALPPALLLQLLEEVHVLLLHATYLLAADDSTMMYIDPIHQGCRCQGLRERVRGSAQIRPPTSTRRAGGVGGTNGCGLVVERAELIRIIPARVQDTAAVHL